MTAEDGAEIHQHTIKRVGAYRAFCGSAFEGIIDSIIPRTSKCLKKWMRWFLGIVAFAWTLHARLRGVPIAADYDRVNALVFVKNVTVLVSPVT